MWAATGCVGSVARCSAGRGVTARLARPAAAMDLSTLAPEVEEKIDVEEMKEYIKGGSQR